MSDRKNLTKRLIESLPTPTDGQRPVVYDEQVRGLGVVVQPSGKRAFIFLRKVNQKVYWKHIADWPAYSVEQAREQAQAWNTELSDWKNGGYEGPSPFDKPADALTFSKLVDEYVARQLKPHAKNPAKAEEDLRWMVGKYLADWKDRKLGDITAEEINARHLRDGGKHGHRTANLAVKQLRTLYRFALRSRLWKGEIPTAGVNFYHENKRTRFLQPAELPKLWAALRGAPNPDLRDYVNLALWTGARKADLLSMRWQDISLEDNRWGVPDPKSQTPYTVPLTPEAVQILKARLRDRTEGCVWVFPGVGKTGHVVDLKKRWKELLQAAGLHHPGDPEMRITQHDLRRTHASWMAGLGTSLPIIARALGHQSTAATQIYARINIDPVRDAMESANKAIGKAMRKKPKLLRAAPRKRLKVARG